MNTGLELIDRIDEKILTPDYDFLRKEPLGENIILLGLGGSYASGTNIETSDIDIRGIATHSAGDILTRGGFEQVTDEKTDTVIYSLEKIFNLLSNCNPNTIEMLGLEPWQYIYVSDIGERLIQNADMFLSRRVVHSFGGYATAQLRRLDNKAVRTVEQAKREAHILASIENAKYTFPDKYFSYPEDAISLYIDDLPPKPDYDRIRKFLIDVNASIVFDDGVKRLVDKMRRGELY